jgi:chromosome segregation protein
MYLKEIKTHGFKSFAEKITLELHPGITGIVGPNGSGKSNIVDAVRWVLGEQSIKSLRGEDTMTDVIFSGSKSREAMNRASVTLIFDNARSLFTT